MSDLAVCDTCDGRRWVWRAWWSAQKTDCPDCARDDNGDPTGYRIVYTDQETP